MATEEDKVYDNMLTLDAFEVLQEQLDSYQADFMNKSYTSKYLDLHILSKLALVKFFDLEMLLKRKISPNDKSATKLEPKLLDFARQILKLEKQCKFKELVSRLLQLPIEKPLKKEDVSKNVRVHVIEKLSGLFTCYKIDDLAAILSLNRIDAERFVRELGYKQEDIWVILEHKLRRDQNAVREKQALKNKLSELTKLTQILQKHSK